jgi:hypothetical protein
MGDITIVCEGLIHYAIGAAQLAIAQLFCARDYAEAISHRLFSATCCLPSIGASLAVVEKAAKRSIGRPMNHPLTTHKSISQKRVG